ncbi:MAG: PQQ-dependent sugar dehydrogenase [Dehalococcoidia bacterium]
MRTRLALLYWLLLSAASVSCDADARERVALEPAFGGRTFDSALDLADVGDGTFLVAERGGQLRRVSADGSKMEVVLDLASTVSLEHEEQGLLSVALDPEFAQNRHVWLYYIARDPLRSVLARFTLPLGGAIDPASGLVVLELAQPYENHKGGAVRFGPDGMLYLGLGDGGDAFDPEGRGQDLATLHGSIIRIDVRTATATSPYRIPPGNPFTEIEGARPEIWAYGLRNPWRMAFDNETGELWAADVGQHEVEEVNRIERGANYGWAVMEGERCLLEECDSRAFVAPLATYRHSEGCSVVGGVVYRGTDIPALRGLYVFGDLCSDRVWTLDGDGDRDELLAVAGPIVSFAADRQGEVYVLQFGQPIMRLRSP